MERVTSVTSWLNNMNADDVRHTKVIHFNEAHNICNLVSRYTQSRGRERGLFFHAHKITTEEFITVVVVCEPRELYLNNIKQGNKYAWKQKIPKNLD